MRMIAHGIEVGLCDDPKCMRVHIDLRNEKDKVFASAVISLDVATRLIASLQSCAYMLATGEKRKAEDD